MLHKHLTLILLIELVKKLENVLQSLQRKHLSIMESVDPVERV